MASLLSCQLATSECSWILATLCSHLHQRQMVREHVSRVHSEVGRCCSWCSDAAVCAVQLSLLVQFKTRQMTGAQIGLIGKLLPGQWSLALAGIRQAASLSELLSFHLCPMQGSFRRGRVCPRPRLGVSVAHVQHRHHVLHGNVRLSCHCCGRSRTGASGMY